MKWHCRDRPTQRSLVLNHLFIFIVKYFGRFGSTKSWQLVSSAGQESQKIRYNHFRGKTGRHLNNSLNSDILNPFWKDRSHTHY